MKCDGVPIKKNQTRALQVLIDPAFSRTMLLYNSPEEMVIRQELIDVSLCYCDVRGCRKLSRLLLCCLDAVCDAQV